VKSTAFYSVYHSAMARKFLADDAYPFHRIALLPLLPGASEVDLTRACEHVARASEQAFAEFLIQQGLAPMWDKLLESSDAGRTLGAEVRDTLRTARIHATASYLIQRHNLTLISEVFEKAGIQHAIYKGAHIRERLYEEPALRPAADIDILVSEGDKAAAIRAFKESGFELYAEKSNISHEVTLSRGNTHIDLHWDILRPGRTRIPMTELVLETRKDYGRQWGTGNETTLFIALVHQVFVSYSTTPQALLIRMLDLAKLLEEKKMNWDEVLELLDAAGLKVAAWVTLHWYQLVTGLTPPAVLLSAIKPGKLRRKYLSFWLEKNYSSRFMANPYYIQAGFTLPVHDKWGDAIRASRSAITLRQSQSADLEQLIKASKTQK